MVGLWAFVSATTYAQTTIIQSVAANSDDAEEEGPTGTTPNWMWLSSSDIELVSDFDPPTAGVQKIGLRFTAMTIPRAATITNAYLNFRAIAADAPMTNSDPTTLTIKGQLIANAPTFTITSGDISSRVLTSASASWVPTSWTTGSDYSSPSIASVIQEIVDQGTWASGNAVAIIITGTGHRASTAYDTDPPNAAELVVTYTTPVRFRSVGITAAALASGGATSALTISGGTATFGSGLPDNIGVGDVIQYDSDGNTSIDALAFIHGRTNSQTYAVRDKNGATPTAVIGDDNWSIYRAYTSLALWESQSENGNILEPVEDDVNPPLNLVTANTRLLVACYGDGPDTTALVINGWTTGPDTYIHIFAPNLPSQVGTSQRHRGVWDNTKYRIEVGNDEVIDIGGGSGLTKHVWIDGLQINLLSTNNQGQVGIVLNHTSAAEDRISNNIIRATSISNTAVYGIFAYNTAAAPATIARIWNNIIYGFNAFAQNTGIYSESGEAFTIYAYNNTIHDCRRGFYRNGGTAGPFILKNNIAYSAYDNYDAGGSTFDASGTNNLSGPGADAQMPPTAARNGVTVTFVDAAGSPPDLHLSTAPADTGALNWGADLSSDPNLAVVGDIDGEVRQAAWDIGADDANGTTAVELLSFEGVGADAAVELSWTTASELDNLGFHVYRSPAVTGPWERITSSLIPGLGSSPTGATYRYRDTGLANGTTYFYLLEDVETSGRLEQHGPVSAIPGSEAGGGSDGSGGGTGTGDGTGEGSGSGARGTTYGEAGLPSLNVVERGPAHVVLELVTPGFVAKGDADRSVRLEVSGFELPQSPGSPAVPVRRALVDARAGRGARITSVRTEGVLTFTDLRVAMEGAPEAVVSDEGMVRPGLALRRAAPGSVREGYYPRTYARLLGTAFQGEIKKARLELSPLRYDAARGQVVLARRLLVRVEFRGVEKGEKSLGGSRGRRPRVGPGRAKGIVAQLVTREAGLYKVPFVSLFPGRASGVPATSLRLSRRGTAVPFHLEPARAPFGPGSFLYFVGGGDLNPNGDAVYELEQGRPGTQMGTIVAAPSGVEVTTHEATRTFEENHYYQAALLDAPDIWLWDLLVSPVTKSHAITSSHVDPGATGHLKVWLQGASDFEADPDHHVRVSLNGSFIGEASWDGKREQAILADLVPGILQNGANTLTVENVGDTPAAYSMVFLNRFEVTQPRLGVVEAGRIDGRFTQSGSAAITGLPAGSPVLDTTDAPTWLTGATESAGVFRFRVEAGRRYLATDPAMVLTPEVRPVSNRLRNLALRADWLLLAPREFLPAASALVELRREQGLLTKTVALEDVYQEFGFGEKGPEAIRAFLGYAWQSWRKPSPKYVVLLGDSTYDPKDYLGTHVADRLPFHPVKTSYLWTASDPAFAAVNGDDLVPDLAIGRLSAGSLAEAQTLVAKLVAFERAGQSLDGKAVLVADNADLAGAFEADADDLAATVLQGREVQKIYLRDLGPGATRAEVRGALDSGASLLSYVGHGATAVWASENIFNNQDVAALATQAEQPLLLTMNCLNGFFHFPPLDSLAEAFVKAEDRGAIAAFSPSGLSLNDPAHLYHKAVLAQISSGAHARLGDALLAAQADYANSGAFPELLSIYHLFGDPALRIRP